jgi:hypothetical protein
MNTLPRELLSELFDHGVRIGTLIHVPAAAIDPEGPAEALERFIEEDAHEDYVIGPFEATWPGYGKAIDDFERSFEEAKQHGSRRAAEQLRKEELAYFFASRCPKPLLVGVEYQVTRCRIADPAGEGLGSWRAGWGHYGTRWMLVDDVLEAANAGLEFAREHRRLEWQKAIDEGRVCQPTPATAPAGGDL